MCECEWWWLEEVSYVIQNQYRISNTEINKNYINIIYLEIYRVLIWKEIFKRSENNCPWRVELEIEDEGQGKSLFIVNLTLLWLIYVIL